MYKNVFALIVDIIDDKCEEDATDNIITFRRMRSWIKDAYDLDVSNSSITMVKNKCGINELMANARYEKVPVLKSRKEQVVLEAFKHFNIVQE